MIDRWRKRYDKFISWYIQNPPEKGIYTEQHHIVPKSLGGSNDSSNLVELPARAHFLAHFMLWRMYKGTPEQHPMVKAFTCMSVGHSNKRKLSPAASRLYDSAAKQKSKTMSLLQTGKGNSHYGTVWVYDTRGFTDFKYRINDRIKKGDKLPEHYAFGRITPDSKWEGEGAGVGLEYWSCQNCGNKFTRKTGKVKTKRTKKCQTCIHTPKPNRITKYRQEFIDAYKKFGSQNQACKAIGISYGSKGDMAKHGRKVLEEEGLLQPLKRTIT